MNTALLSRASSLIAAQQSFAVATVVRRESPSSARLGDTAIVTRDGTLHGFIGGSCTRATLIEHALEVLERGEPRLISFREDTARADDIVSVPMTCHSGGSVEIYIDPVFPAPRLLVLGASPVTHALATVGKAMGLTVHVGGAEARGDLPDGVDEVLESVPELESRYAAREAGVKLFVVVATMGESDEDMLMAAIEARADYLGVIASLRRMEEIRGNLVRRGAPRDAVDAIHGPAGLDLGGTKPEEIAVSILAQIIASQHGLTPAGRPAGSKTAGSTLAGTTPVAGTAVDPVCGMTVRTDGSKPQLRHGGTIYHFCRNGCRERFVADPQRYVTATQEKAPSAEGDTG